MATAALRTERLDLEPVSPAHADEMVDLLADRALYAFYADEASPSLDELRTRYSRWAAGGSPDGRETWCTWILRLRGSGTCVGFVQATVRLEDRTAELAWVVGTAYQGQGLAREAAAAVRDAVLAGTHATGADPVAHVEAHIAPGNAASEAVARAAGLEPTQDHDADGERIWRLPASARPA
ncbi:MAG: GNAT family N-acetyltransferase [Candidatus Nanopelagicales bacterium]